MVNQHNAQEIVAEQIKGTHERFVDALFADASLPACAERRKSATLAGKLGGLGAFHSAAGSISEDVKEAERTFAFRSPTPARNVSYVRRLSSRSLDDCARVTFDFLHRLGATAEVTG